MKRNTPILVIGLFVSLSIWAPCRAQQPNSPTADREERWRADLKLFASEFPARHKDFKKLYSQPDFDNQIVALQKKHSHTLRLRGNVATHAYRSQRQYRTNNSLFPRDEVGVSEFA